MSTFTGLDDYDTLFTARHGRGALDPVPKMGGQILIPMVGPELINPKEKGTSIHEDIHIEQKETLKLQIASPSSEIIGEGAAIFTDMTETILNILDKQEVTSPSSQQHTRELPSSQRESVHSKKPRDPAQKDDYPDLFLPIRENYRISDHFQGYSDSLSTDNNPMVLVELHNLAI